jgi:DNA-binding LacI/PurR family transcriptional regulator
MKRHTEVTIYDLAKKLNLATSTISRALSDHHSISKKTIEKVKKAANEVGYRPNNLAASLRNKKTKTIGVLIPTIAQPFLSSLISGVEITAQEAGYNVVIMQSHDSYEEELNLVQSLYSSRVSGVICCLAMETPDTEHFKIFTDNNIPLVFVDRVPKHAETYRVMIDNYAAGYKATKHLVEQGCLKIAHITRASEFGGVYNERKRGYTDALKDCNIPIDNKLIVNLNSVSYEETEAATNKLLNLKNPPDGIFAAGDMLAINAMQCAKKRGVKIPEELAVIGFNNDPNSRIIEPNLSTISHPAGKMGQASAEIILKNIEQSIKDDIKEITFLNTEVLARESSKRK